MAKTKFFFINVCKFRLLVYLYFMNEQRNNNEMKITATKEFAKVTFTWNEDLTECNHTALGVSDEDFDALIKNKVHEGAELKGWSVSIN